MSSARGYAIVILCLLAILSVGFFAQQAWFASPQSAIAPVEPLFGGLGSYSRKITTDSSQAQQYFDQGLAFLCGFNHEEAARSFEAAIAADPRCAMAYWGLAMACGPDINDLTFDFSRAKGAWTAATKARELSSSATPVERALIEAVNKRYIYPPPTDRKELDKAYAAAMQGVRKAFPDDPDVGALAAESLMDLRPWDLWTHDGRPQPGTEEVVATLDGVLARDPTHPFALHLLIHAVEASPHPEKAEVAADRLRDMTPGLEHLLHMPSHIDVHRGRWQEAVVANEKAVAADKTYRQLAGARDPFSLSAAHSYHMLAYAAMMQGESQKASRALQEMLASIPDDAIRANPGRFDGLFAMPYELSLRFGRWNDLLTDSPPRAAFPIATALWHYARGIALAAKKKVDQSKAEQKAFLAARATLPADAVVLSCPAGRLLDIAEKMLEGEILYREGKVDESLTALREAVRREDDLSYADPPNWLFPVRHALGATLMDARRYAEAEAVYREDLARRPENGWSLYGLARSLKLQNKLAESAAVLSRFDRIWQHADTKLSSSCFCLPARE